MSETQLLLELAILINRGSFHGSWLVRSSSGTDNVATAEKLLLEAERENLITRGKLDPSRDQLFFGVGGLTGAQLKEPHASAICYHWITKTTEHL